MTEDEGMAWAALNLPDARLLITVIESFLMEANAEVPVAMFALTHCMGRVLAASSDSEERLQGGVNIASTKLKEIAMRYFAIRQELEMEDRTGSVQ